MMKRLGLFLFAVLFIAAVSGGCDNFKGDDGENLTANEFNKRGTLQGFLYNAITGAPISYSTEGENLVKVRLQQGQETRNPNKLVTDAAEPLVGLYVFNDIPFSLYGNILYPIIVTVPGYQKFVGNVVPAALLPVTGGTPANAGEWSNYIDTDVVMDANYNGQGNIYLFPVGATSGNVMVTVRDPLTRLVPGVTVRLQQNIAGNVPIGEISVGGTRLLPAAGHMTSFSAVTDTAGVATFAESTLVLGGSYTPTSDPLTYIGQELLGVAGAAFIIGTGDVHVAFAPADPHPALYVVSASNSVPGSVTATGVLTLEFNKEIALNLEVLADSTQFTAVVADTAVVTAVVTASIDATGKILTLTPVFTPTAGPLSAGATITYNQAGAGRVFARDTQTALPGAMTNAAGVFNNVTTRTGGAGSVGSVVQIRTR